MVSTLASCLLPAQCRQHLSLTQGPGGARAYFIAGHRCHGVRRRPDYAYSPSRAQDTSATTAARTVFSISRWLRARRVNRPRMRTECGPPFMRDRSCNSTSRALHESMARPGRKPKRNKGLGVFSDPTNPKRLPTSRPLFSRPTGFLIQSFALLAPDWPLRSPAPSHQRETLYQGRSARPPPACQQSSSARPDHQRT